MAMNVEPVLPSRAWWPYPGLAGAHDAAHADLARTRLHGAGITRLDHAGGHAWWRRSKWDTAFFGRAIHEVVGWCGGGDPLGLAQSVTETLASDGSTYAFAKVPASDEDAVAALRTSGWTTVETRVTYGIDLAAFTPLRRFALREATPEDVPRLAAAAVAARNPHDRFRADSWFSEPEVDALMAEWVRASIVDGFADVVLVPETGADAFMTVNLLPDDGARLGVPIGQLVFSAVAPGYTGWYARLVSESLALLKFRGRVWAFMTTQPENTAVTRCWDRVGAVPTHRTRVCRRVFQG